MGFYKEYVRDPFTLFLDTFKNKKLGLVILLDLAFFMIFLHYESLSSLTPNKRIFIILLEIQLISCFLIFAHSVEILQFNTTFYFLRLILNFGNLIALVISLQTISKINRMARAKTTKFEFIGLFLLF